MAQVNDADHQKTCTVNINSTVHNMFHSQLSPGFIINYLADNRRGFMFDNVRKHLIVQCYHKGKNYKQQSFSYA